MKDSRQCPKYGQDDSLDPWFDLYRHYSAGHLYCDGGVRAQPALYLYVMRLIDGAVKESNG